jgi:hypothetical protein
MSQTVHKFPLTPRQPNLSMPADAELLHVGVQGTEAFLWALVDTDAPTTLRTVHAVPTGGVVPAGSIYVGTFAIRDLGSLELICHVFDGGETT